MVRDFVNLEGNVDRAAQGREPLGPAAGFPQAVGFDETDRGVECGEAGDPPQARIVHVGHRVNENLRIVARGIQVEARDEAFGKVFGVPAQETQCTEADREHGEAFEGFEGRDGAEAGGRTMRRSRHVEAGS